MTCECVKCDAINTELIFGETMTELGHDISGLADGMYKIDGSDLVAISGTKFDLLASILSRWA